MPVSPTRQQPTAASKDTEIAVSIVTVTYRNQSDIAPCLAALDQAAAGLSAEVIIVDNASGDGTADVARAAAESTALTAQVIERTSNGGFAAGCWTGAAAARGRWLLFLNPDTVIAAEAIGALLSCARTHQSAGIVGGRFVHADGTVDPRSWWGRPTPWSVLCFALGLSSLLPGNPRFDPESPRPWTSDPDQVQTVPVVSGAFMLVEHDLWDQLGGFDRAFFMYAEDADLCLRAADLGYQPVVTAQAVCHHEGGKSSSSIGKLVLLFTGKATLVRRHFPVGLRGLGVAMLLTGVFVRSAGSRIGFSVSQGRQHRPTTRGQDWQALWAARGQWRRGWTAQAPAPDRGQ